MIIQNNVTSLRALIAALRLKAATVGGQNLDLARFTNPELLKLHADIGEELRTREVLRSSNNPTGDLAEYLFCKAFGWRRLGNANASIDAIDPNDGRRYQIKGRRLTRYSSSRQLSALRELPGEHFDFLAGLLFSEDYLILKAALIPHSIVLARATFVARTNSHRFLLQDDIWNAAGVRDVTVQLNSVLL